MATWAWSLGLSLAILAQAASTGSGAEPPLIREADMPLDGVAGRIDHLAFDSTRQRLVIAELGNGTVDVVDIGSGRRVARISGLHEPQGVAYVAGVDLIVVADGGDGMLRSYHASDLSPAATLQLGDDADNVRVDSATGEVVVGYGAGALAAVDPVSMQVRRTVELPAHPEAFQLDPDQGRVLVNLPGASLVAVVDLRGGRILDRWPTRGLHANFPLAVDTAAHRLATVFRDPPHLVLLDWEDGSRRAVAETCGDADDVFFDHRRGRLYVICGAGAVEVFTVSAGALEPLGRVSTAPGARTGLFVPELDRLFVAARQPVAGGPAKIIALRPR
jgi:hypothetical protein